MGILVFKLQFLHVNQNFEVRCSRFRCDIEEVSKNKSWGLFLKRYTVHLRRLVAALVRRSGVRRTDVTDLHKIRHCSRYRFSLLRMLINKAAFS